VRVLARPWAHVVVDGQFVETTPFARAIPLAPGTHHVTLKHPAAPDERRTVRLAPGERVVLDVTMRVKTSPTAEPGRSAAPEPSSSSP
jgi:serine/threonine-protein kinase